METDTRIFYLLSFIFSLIGGILVLATDFSCAYGYYKICIFIGSVYMGAYDGVVIALGIILICSGVLSLLLILKPEFANINIIRVNLLISIGGFIFVLAGIIISAVEYEGIEWYPEAGFYGGIFGSLISMICLLMVVKAEEISLFSKPK